MSISIYGLVSFDRSSKVRWLCEEMGVPYQDHWLNREKNELNEGAYLNINPLGRVPAVLIDDRPMIESGGIVAYLADLHSHKGFAPHLSAPERMEYQQWMYFAANTTEPFTARISIIEDIPPGEVFDKKMGELMTEIKEAIAFLNQVLLKKEYLAKNFSAADICVGYSLYTASLWPEIKEIIDANPQVAAYLVKLQARQGAIRAKVFSYEA